MNLFYLYLLYIIPTTYSYIYKNGINPHPHSIYYNLNQKKDFNVIDHKQVSQLLYFWYGDNEKKNTDLCYTNMIKKNEVEYLIWIPRIKSHHFNDDITNSLFYPCFRETMFIICFNSNENSNIVIHNLIQTPMWTFKDEIIHKKVKLILIEYFLKFKNYKTISFKI